jgi:hypothetical protein
MNVAYHYTTSARLAEILPDGAILPRTRSWRVDPYGVANAVWFSAAPVWEPACSATVEIGPAVPLPAGVVPGRPFEAARIAVRESDTRPWDTGLLRCLTHWWVLWRLFNTGVDLGSHPDEWRVSLTPVPMSAWLTVEVWDGGNWVPLEDKVGACTVETLAEMIGAAPAGDTVTAEEGGRREAV